MDAQNKDLFNRLTSLKIPVIPAFTIMEFKMDSGRFFIDLTRGFRNKGGNRAYVDTGAAGITRGHIRFCVSQKTDQCIKTALGKCEIRLVMMMAANVNALTAKHASVRIVRYKMMALFDLYFF